ncbi:hypothetical protein D3C71_1352980 [compost metagenome]
MAMMLTVMPPMMPGSASGSSTWRTMCQRRQPMARAASTSPWSTSFRLTCAMRAKNGTRLADSGTMAAQVPSVVPTRNRVKGSIATSRMMNGMERKVFTVTESTLLKRGLGYRLPGAVMVSTTASARPDTMAMTADMLTIARVCRKACRYLSSIGNDIAQHLDLIGHQRGARGLFL